MLIVSLLWCTFKASIHILQDWLVPLTHSMVNPYVICDVISVIQYYIYVMYVIAQMVPAGHTIFPMIGQYQIYIMDVIAQMVPAGPTIFPMIGRYQIYMMDVFAQMVLAGTTIFPMIGRYQIYMMY